MSALSNSANTSVAVKYLSLTTLIKNDKISWTSTNPYNKRWEFKWKHSYYTYPRDGDEHTNVKKPEDSKATVPLFYAYYLDLIYRWIPAGKTWWDRRARMYDPFSLYFLPGMSLFFYQISDINTGFKVKNPP